MTDNNLCSGSICRTLESVMVVFEKLSQAEGAKTKEVDHDDEEFDFMLEE